MPQRKKLLTIAEAAEFLKVSKTTLRRWTNSGQLACYRVGRRSERRFLSDDLAALVGGFAAVPDNAAADEIPLRDEKPVRHNHICTYYKSPKEQWQLFRTHLFAHLHEHARIVYLYHCEDAHLRQWLQQEGLDVEELIRSGRLTLASTAETYLLDGFFNTERQLAFWRKIIDGNRARGTRNLLLTGEMGWASSGAKGCDQLVPYEAVLDQVLEAYPWVTVVCQYPIYQFSGATVFDNLRVHTHLQLPDKLIPGFG
ncbi:MAG: MEDS domain-containing protein [Gammaproteobacteria bacterium]